MTHKANILPSLTPLAEKIRKVVFDVFSKSYLYFVPDLFKGYQFELL